MGKVRTTINIEEEVSDAVRESGVKNFSAHVEQLLVRDIAAVDVNDKQDAELLGVREDELSELEKEWMSYEKGSSSLK